MRHRERGRWDAGTKKERDARKGEKGRRFGRREEEVRRKFLVSPSFGRNQ